MLHKPHHPIRWVPSSIERFGLTRGERDIAIVDARPGTTSDRVRAPCRRTGRLYVQSRKWMLLMGQQPC
jgi:hypothetical protein